MTNCLQKTHFISLVAGAALAIGGAGLAASPAGAQAKGAPVSPQTAKLMATIHSINQGEIEIGRLGQERASDPSVKKYGAMLERDHRKADEKLTSLSKKVGVDLEAQGVGPIPELEKLKAQLEEAKGREFDAIFTGGNAQAHKHAIAKLEQAESQIRNQDVLAYVKGLIPVLKKHEREAERLQPEVASRRVSKGS